MNRIITFLLAVGSVVAVPSDSCACGHKGCAHIKKNAKCNSYVHQKILNAGLEFHPDDCHNNTTSISLGKQGASIAHCELQECAPVTVTALQSAFAFMAWLPLITWAGEPPLKKQQ